MKRFLGFVKKEIYHIFRDKRTLLILFGMPIVQILLFGFAITTELREAKVAVLDLSRDEYTASITEKILATPFYLLESQLDSYDQIEPAFQAGRVKQVMVFEAGFGEKLEREGEAAIHVISDATDPNVASTLLNYTTAIVNDYQQELAAERGATALPMRMNVQARMRYNPELKGVYLFVPGLITIILMLVSAMMTSISITREREIGTMEVLLASPMKSWQVILGKVTPYIFLSLVNALLILGLGVYVFGVPIVGSLSLLIAESLLFILAALSLGILISTVAKTQQVALMISLMGLMLPTILLSGFIFPIENMPTVLQIISNAIPARWFIIIVKDIMLKGTGLAGVWQETLILSGFTLFFLLVSIRRFKVRLE
jgi:ABC-2 type transport system permease protein